MPGCGEIEIWTHRRIVNLLGRRNAETGVAKLRVTLQWIQSRDSGKNRRPKVPIDVDNRPMAVGMNRFLRRA